MSTRRLRTLCMFVFLALLPIAANAQWKKIAAYRGTFFNEVFFIDASRGWLTQHLGIVVRTTDGGNTWQQANLPGATGSFNRDICFVSPTHGFVSGDDGIWKTTDGGVSWANITPPGIVTGNASHWFIDPNNGVYGFGPCNFDTVRFYRTSNGGVTWDSVRYGFPPAQGDVAVGGICYYGGVYYAAGGVGKLWRSNDNGATWTFNSTNSGGFHEDAVAAMNGVIHAPSVDGSVCGISGSSKICRSLDAGNTWSSIAFPGVVMWGISFYSPQEGWACADRGHAYHTTDGGATWTEKSCGMSATDRVDDIHFTSAINGWAVGDGIYKFVGDDYTTRPDTINFGDIVVGSTSADSSAIITALGSPIVVTTRVLTGLNPLDFQATGGLGALNVASCQDAATLVRFRPLSEGIKIARIDFTIAGFPGIATVYLKGRGVKPVIASARALNFDTLVCSIRATDTVYVRNTGTAPLRIFTASTLAPANVSFQLLSPAIPAVIPTNDSVAFIVQVNTSVPGAAGGTLTLTSNDPDSGKSPWVITLNAYRRQIAASINRDTLLVIPPEAFGKLSSSCLYYQNSGDGIQIIDSVKAVGLDAAIQHYPAAGGTRVARGSVHALCFTASATDTNTHTRRFKVRTMPCGLDTFITVIYKAANPVIESARSMTIVSGACDTSAVDTLVLTNRGNLPLVVDRPFFGGTNPGAFSIDSPTMWPDTIAPGDELRVAIRAVFAATAPTATITFPNNDGLPGKNNWKVDLAAARGASELTLSRRRIDIGDICVGDALRLEHVMLRNVGNAPALIRGVTPIDSTDAVKVAAAPPATLVPNAADSVSFAVQAIAAGPFLATYVIHYDPCDRLDTITITGRGVLVDISGTPSLDYGSAQTGRPAQRTYTITNTGTSNATIGSWSFDPPLPNVRVVSPSLPLALAPGQGVDVTVEITPSDTGALRVMLSGIASAPCPDTARTELIILGVKGAVLLDRLQLAMGTMVACDAAPSVDTVRLRNSGASPVDVRSVSLSGTAFVVDPSISFPQPIAPGATLALPVVLQPGVYGPALDTLVVMIDQPEQPVLRIPLSANRERAALDVLDSSGARVSRISFGMLTKCAASRRMTVRLNNPGTLDDTVSVTVAGAEFSYGGPASVIVPPGGGTDLLIEASMNADGAASGLLTLNWTPCGRVERVDLDARYESAASAIADVDFGPVYPDDPVERVLDLRSIGTADQIVDTVYLGAASPGFSIVGNYAGLTLPAGGSIPVTLRYVAMAPGNAAAQVVAALRSPCADTVRAQATAEATRDEIDTVMARAGSARARWGTLVDVPIAFDNSQGASMRAMELVVTAAPTLLDPLDVRLSPEVQDWQLERLGYDPATGSLRLKLTAGYAAPLLVSSDSLLVIRYNVLRGDLVESGLAVRLDGLPANVIALTEDGDFVLEDYCDAYGRRLRVLGNIALDQNTPNPFNPVTTIEFETAFRGHVMIVVYDGLGREVARPVDEELPAGRRRVVFDAGNLPSGVYTYRLFTGLQTITRRMSVTK